MCCDCSVHIIEPPLGSILFTPEISFNLSLRAGISYKIGITDSRHTLPSPNPRTIPRAFLQPEPNTGMFVYLDVNMTKGLSFSSLTIILQVIKQTKLKRKEKPCVSSTDYSLSDCLLRKITSDVGCQTHFTNISGFPTCTEREEILRTIRRYQDLIVNNELFDLTQKSGCDISCQFMEYKVRRTPPYPLKQF